MSTVSPRRHFLKSLTVAALAVLLGVSAAGIAGCDGKEKDHTLNAGFFPNVTHAQAIIARELAREGKPWFEPRLPQGWKLEWVGFNAGPSAMESLITGSVDVTYVGPSPVINAHVRTRGEHIRLLAGSAVGGSALVVPKDSAKMKPGDFRKCRIATPQLGNTQDVACRAWLAAGGLKFNVQGGDVLVVPTPNPDQADLIAAGRVDGVWTVEPWVTRIVKLTGAKIVHELPEETTTVLVTDRKILATPKKPAIEAFLKAHLELTDWIAAHREEAETLLHKGLAYEMRAKNLPKDLVVESFSRVKLTGKVNFADLDKAMKDAHTAGLLKDTAPLAPLREYYHDDSAR